MILSCFVIHLKFTIDCMGVLIDMQVFMMPSSNGKIIMYHFHMGCNTGIFKGNYIDGKPQYKRKFIIIYCRREKKFR